jgi:hypothetical protein
MKTDYDDFVTFQTSGSYNPNIAVSPMFPAGPIAATTGGLPYAGNNYSSRIRMEKSHYKTLSEARNGITGFVVS